jgi:hypothetical protein
MFNISKMMKSAAPQMKSPANPAIETPETTQANPSPSGFVDIKAAYEQIGKYMKNPHGYSFDVKAESKNGVHTFTITVKPTDMMQKAEENGAVQQPAGQGVPQAPEKAPTPNVVPGPGSADMQQEEQRAAAAKKNVKTAAINLKDAYPADFLKMIDL